ncbi:DIXC1 protein, partial [Atractosteus spatula]|nr:DIXC1 protein [Atractosteus spatula]
MYDAVAEMPIYSVVNKRSKAGGQRQEELHYAEIQRGGSASRAALWGRADGPRCFEDAYLTDRVAGVTQAGLTWRLHPSRTHNGWPYADFWRAGARKREPGSEPAMTTNTPAEGSVSTPRGRALRPLPGRDRNGKTLCFSVVQQQLQAYVSWVNSQLKRKPGLQPVQDLRRDLRDGVVLAHLIEIVAGELLEGVHYSPADPQEMRENVEKVLQFVASKRIRMHQTSARDIVEGNLKSVMRLILALAAHFKPSASANQRAAAGAGPGQPGPSLNHRPHSATAMAQNAVAALAAARHDASHSGRGVFLFRQDRQRLVGGAHSVPFPRSAVWATPGTGAPHARVLCGSELRHFCIPAATGLAGRRPSQGRHQAQGHHMPASSVAQNCVTSVSQLPQGWPGGVPLRSGTSARSAVRQQRKRKRSSSVDEEIENPSWSVRALVQQYEGQREAPAGDGEALPSGQHSPSPTGRVSRTSRGVCRCGSDALRGARGGVGSARAPFCHKGRSAARRVASLRLHCQNGLSSPSPAHTPKGELAVGQSESQEATLGAQLEEAHCKAEVLVMAPLGGPVGAGEGSSWEDQLLEQQEQLEREMEEARRMISSLQGAEVLWQATGVGLPGPRKRSLGQRDRAVREALLLHGSLPEDEQEASLCLGGEGADNAEEQLIIIRSRLDQSMAESQDLKKELLRYKQETRSLQGVKDALQQRMSLQESSVLQLKQELLRASMARDELHSQNVELQRMLEERSRLLTDYKKELGHKDRLLQQQQLKLDEALRKLCPVTAQADLQRELEHKDSLLQELMSRDVDGIEHCGSLGHAQSNGYIHPAGTASSMASTHRGAEELQLVREALRSLRNCFSGHDPQHHTLDTLEQGIASLMDRLHALDSQRRHEKREPAVRGSLSRGKSPGRRAAHSDRDSWPPSSKMSHSHSSPVLSSSATTKVLYFTDRSLTPFMVNIPKRLGEVTLRDFKAAVDREGSYRYHFKALDPEFGTVKEEVFHDDAVVPGWEGKIVAWVEEDHGEDRQSWWHGDPTKE